MQRVLVFDVNETLLDLAALDPIFDRLFGDATARREWFATVLRTSMAMTVAGVEGNFVEVAGAALRMVGDARGVELPNGALADVATAMREMPPHPDVVAGLSTLRDADVPMIALTNSPQATADAQLANAGMADFFDRVMSVEPTGRFKPHRAVYEMAATTVGRPPQDLMMVAAHDWDIAGAMAAGYEGALIVRPGMAANPIFPNPTLVGSDLVEIASQIV